MRACALVELRSHWRTTQSVVFVVALVGPALVGCGGNAQHATDAASNDGDTGAAASCGTPGVIGTAQVTAFPWDGVSVFKGAPPEIVITSYLPDGSPLASALATTSVTPGGTTTVAVASGGIVLAEVMQYPFSAVPHFSGIACVEPGDNLVLGTPPPPDASCSTGVGYMSVQFPSIAGAGWYEVDFPLNGTSNSSSWPTQPISFSGCVGSNADYIAVASDTQNGRMLGYWSGTVMFVDQGTIQLQNGDVPQPFDLELVDIPAKVEASNQILSLKIDSVEHYGVPYASSYAPTGATFQSSFHFDLPAQLSTIMSIRFAMAEPHPGNDYVYDYQRVAMTLPISATATADVGQLLLPELLDFGVTPTPADGFAVRWTQAGMPYLPYDAVIITASVQSTQTAFQDFVLTEIAPPGAEAIVPHLPDLEEFEHLTGIETIFFQASAIRDSQYDSYDELRNGQRHTERPEVVVTSQGQL